MNFSDDWITHKFDKFLGDSVIKIFQNLVLGGWFACTLLPR